MVNNSKRPQELEQHKGYVVLSKRHLPGNGALRFVSSNMLVHAGTSCEHASEFRVLKTCEKEWRI
jgi:hypothetical protein